MWKLKNDRWKKRPNAKEKDIILKKWQDLEQWQNWHFAEAIARQNNQKWIISGLNFKMHKKSQKRLCINITIVCLWKKPDILKMARYWKVAEIAILSSSLA